MMIGVGKDLELIFIAIPIQAATYQSCVHKILQYSQKARCALATENSSLQTPHTVSTIKLFPCRPRSVPRLRSCHLMTRASAMRLWFVSQSWCARKTMGALSGQTPVLTCLRWLMDLLAATANRQMQSVIQAKPVEVRTIRAMILQNASIPCFYQIGASFWQPTRRQLILMMKNLLWRELVCPWDVYQELLEKTSWTLMIHTQMFSLYDAQVIPAG